MRTGDLPQAIQQATDAQVRVNCVVTVRDDPCTMPSDRYVEVCVSRRGSLVHLRQKKRLTIISHSRRKRWEAEEGGYGLHLATIDATSQRFAVLAEQHAADFATRAAEHDREGSFP
jgi:hypothetical protein